MDDIIDVNFNFELFDVMIANALNEFNVAKDKYFNGEEVCDTVKEKAEALIKLIETCLQLTEMRIKLIDNHLNEGKLERRKLVEERVSLVRVYQWYKGLKGSIEKDYKIICLGEMGSDDEQTC